MVRNHALTRSSDVDAPRIRPVRARQTTQKVVYLYSAIGEREQHRPIHRSPLAEMQIRMGRMRDDLMWRGLGRWQYHYWRYEDRQGSNIGDIAVREACGELLRRTLPSNLVLRSVSWNRLDEATVEEINREGSAFVVAGGGYFIFDGNWRLGRRVDIDLPAVAALHVPRIMMGVGVNNPVVRELPQTEPKLTPDVERRLSQLLAEFDLITVRDTFSQRMLQRFTSDEVLLVPDPALFLASLRQNGVARTRRETELTVGLNLALHGNYSEALLQKNFPTYAEAFRAYQKETGCAYLYFPHSDAERKIAELLSQAGIQLDLVQGDVDELLRHYRGLSFHICQMLHSSILAMSTDCPTLNLAYDVKNHGFFRTMGVPEYCLSADTVTTQDILQAMLRIAAQRDDLRRHLAERRRDLTPVMSRALRHVGAIISGQR